MKYNSDHSPILLKLGCAPHNVMRKDQAFKFETVWLFDDSCELAIREAWEDAIGGSVFHKLGSVGSKLHIWSRAKYDKLGKQIEETDKALRSTQQKEISRENCEECGNFESALDDLHCKHKAY